MEQTRVSVTVMVESPLGEAEETTLELTLISRVPAETAGGAARHAVAKVLEALGAYR
jgi:hypothetical protein